MLGKFQQSQVRIEINADEATLGDCFLNGETLSKWFLTSKFEPNLPHRLSAGLDFYTRIGLLPIANHVDVADRNCLRLLLSKSIDGYQEWLWGDGWVQSRLEGISLLPLSLGQTLSLLRLRNFVARRSAARG